MANYVGWVTCHYCEKRVAVYLPSGLTREERDRQAAGRRRAWLLSHAPPPHLREVHSIAVHGRCRGSTTSVTEWDTAPQRP